MEHITYAEFAGTGTLKETDAALSSGEVVSSGITGQEIKVGHLIVNVPMTDLRAINNRQDVRRQNAMYKFISDSNTVYSLKESGSIKKVDGGYAPELVNDFRITINMDNPYIGYTRRMSNVEVKVREQSLANHIANLLNKYPFE